MEENNRPTKRELKELRRLEKLDQKKQGGSQSSMKWIVLGLGGFLFLAFFGALIFLTKQSSQKAVTFSDLGWVKGAKDSKVTIVEFADYQCPACKTYNPIVNQVVDKYDERGVRLMYKHFPLSSHANAIPAALAAEAAGAQGKFFEMNDMLYERQEEWAKLLSDEAKEKFISYAREMKLDEEKFKEDLKDKGLENKIKTNLDEGINSGVTGTPTFFINNKRIDNPSSLEQFSYLVEQALK